MTDMLSLYWYIIIPQVNMFLEREKQVGHVE
jgi:hypothetical protein